MCQLAKPDSLCYNYQHLTLFDEKQYISSALISPSERKTTMKSEQTASRVNTQELLLILQEAEAIEPILNEFSEQMNSPSFSSQLMMCMEERGLTVSKLSEAAMLSRSFTYQLCSGDRVPGRDIVLRLALALGLTVDEAQQLLRTAQKGSLYPRVQRDAIIIFCLSHKNGIYETDELLTSHGETSLL